MSNSLWKKQLSEKLKNPAWDKESRLAIVGIGAELNGDDAVGVITAQMLKTALKTGQNVQVFEGGRLPENIISPLRRFLPELVIFIDAADFGGVPGEIRLIEPGQISGADFSTHSLPLSLMIEYLSREIGCDVMILGIQPKDVEFDALLCVECEMSVMEIVKELKRLLNE